MEKTKQSKESSHIFQFALVVVILAVAGGIFVGLKLLKKEPVKIERSFPGPMVNVMTVKKSDVQMTVHGYGTVRAKTEIEIVPEVAGKIIEVHPQWADGGFFTRSEFLLKVDPSDYELAVQRAEAGVARAQVKLEQEQAEGEVAREEWNQLNPGEEPTSPLVLRVPQIREAQAELKAAEAELQKARLDLERTVIWAPFNGRIISKNVDTGQYVQAGQAVAEVYGTEVVEIPVPLEDKDLAWFDLPTAHTQQVDHPKVQATILYDYAGQPCKRIGYITRSNALVDKNSRMIHVIVEVEDPFANGDLSPLVPGTFVRVEIQGRQLKDTFVVPSHAVRNGREVWVANDSNLHIKPVSIARRTPRHTYIGKGLNHGDLLILTSLETATEGMKLRVSEQSHE
jgi:RND family efflux transporter MFP subunit